MLFSYRIWMLFVRLSSKRNGKIRARPLIHRHEYNAHKHTNTHTYYYLIERRWCLSSVPHDVRIYKWSARLACLRICAYSIYTFILYYRRHVSANGLFESTHPAGMGYNIYTGRDYYYSIYKILFQSVFAFPLLRCQQTAIHNYIYIYIYYSYRCQWCISHCVSLSMQKYDPIESRCDCPYARRCMWMCERARERERQTNECWYIYIIRWQKQHSQQAVNIINWTNENVHPSPPIGAFRSLSSTFLSLCGAHDSLLPPIRFASAKRCRPIYVYMDGIVGVYALPMCACPWWRCARDANMDGCYIIYIHIRKHTHTHTHPHWQAPAIHAKYKLLATFFVLSLGIRRMTSSRMFVCLGVRVDCQHISSLSNALYMLTLFTPFSKFSVPGVWLIVCANNTIAHSLFVYI